LFDFVEEAEETTLREFFRVEFFRSDDLTAVLCEFETLDVTIDVEANLSYNINFVFSVEFSLKRFVDADNAISASTFARFEVLDSAPSRLSSEFEESPLTVTTE